MKKNININLCGVIYAIDEDACQLLEQYLDNIKSYFSRQEGGEEIAARGVDADEQRRGSASGLGRRRRAAGRERGGGRGDGPDEGVVREELGGAASGAGELLQDGEEPAPREHRTGSGRNGRSHRDRFRRPRRGRGTCAMLPKRRAASQPLEAPKTPFPHFPTNRPERAGADIRARTLPVVCMSFRLSRGRAFCYNAPR